MANELVALGVTQQEIDNVSNILEKAKEPLPIRGKRDQEGPHLPVTEALLAGMKAQKKRLHSRNLQVNVKSKAKLPTKKEKKEEFPYQIILDEGNYRIGRLRRQWEQSIIYQRGQKELSTLRSTKWFYYYILKEKEEGCRISSVFTDDNDGEHVKHFGRDEECVDGEGKIEISNMLIITLLCGPFLYLLVFGLVWVCLIEKSWPGWIMVLSVVFLWKYIFAAVWCPWLIARLVIWKTKRKKSRKITTSLFEKSSGFCLEKFISILNSKLLRFIYADSTEEIGDLAGCDMTQFLQDHADVINCEFQNFWFTDLREDRDYMYLDMTYKVSLERDLEQKIGRSRETIKLQLARPLDGIMSADFYHDWSIARIETHES